MEPSHRFVKPGHRDAYPGPGLQRHGHFPGGQHPKRPFEFTAPEVPARSCNYVELHCHSAFSLHEGTSLPEELIQAARMLGYPALALTDHDSLAGAMQFAMAAR